MSSSKLSFHPFNERGPVRTYHNGFLPHWRQTGCTYFVTFRLTDSIPTAVLNEWKYERQQWLASRGIDASQKANANPYASLTKKDRELFERHFVKKLFIKLDQGHGQCVLSDYHAARIVLDSMLFFHGERFDCGDVVVMPNHVHALLTPYPSFQLEDILHSVKSYSANRINELSGACGTLWMNESHDHIVRDGEELLRIQRYIRFNPEKARLSAGQFLMHTAEYDLFDS